MSSITGRIRSTLLSTAKTAGVLSLVRDSKWRQQRLLVLGWHGVSIEDEHEWDPTVYTPQDVFRDRLRFLIAERYSILPFREAIDRLYSGTLPNRSIALTFDDGLHDFASRAYPVLNELNVPATVFVTTYYSVNRYPVFGPMFSYLLWRGRNRTIDLSLLIPNGGRFDLSCPEQRAQAVSKYREFIHSVRPCNEDRSKLLRQLGKEVGVDYDDICAKQILHIMDPDTVRTLKNSGVDIQLHTHRHKNCTDESMLTREVRDNKHALEAMGINAGELTHFSYPSGKYFPGVEQSLRNEWLCAACTWYGGLATAQTNRFSIPRHVDKGASSLLEFEGWTSGFTMLLPHRKPADIAELYDWTPQ